VPSCPAEEASSGPREAAAAAAAEDDAVADGVARSPYAERA